MPSVHVRDVWVQYQLLTVSDYNFKRRLMTGMSRKRYRGETSTLDALSGISLTVKEGDRIGVIGVNGSGKSTLLRVLAGALPPIRGEVRIRGRLLPLLGSSGAGLEYELTGIENIMLLGLLLGESTKQMRARLDEIAEFSGLGDRLLNPVGTYSAGMTARLRFTVLTSLRPEILIMDEGVAAADAEFTARARERLNDFMGSAGILVMSSHGPEVARLCSTAVWVHEGSIVCAGPSAEVYGAYSRFVTARTGAPAQEQDALGSVLVDV